MKPIPEEVVVASWKRIIKLPDSEIEILMDEMQDKQPYLSEYLVSADTDIFNDEEHTLFYSLGIIVWKIISSGNLKLKKVLSKTIEQNEELNLKLVKSFTTQDEFNSFVDVTFEKYNQKTLLLFIILQLIQNEKEQKSPPETYGNMLLLLKTEIDCLDQ